MADLNIDWDAVGTNALGAALGTIGARLAPPPPAPAPGPGTAPAGAPQVQAPQEQGFTMNPWMIGVAAIVAVGVIVYIAKS